MKMPIERKNVEDLRLFGWSVLTLHKPYEVLEHPYMARCFVQFSLRQSRVAHQGRFVCLSLL